MKKKAEEIFYKQVGKVLTATSRDSAEQGLSELVNLSDILDQMGQDKDADHIDMATAQLTTLVKESQWWTALMGGGGAAFKSLWDRQKSGKPLFNKESLIDIITKALLAGGIAVLVEELLGTLEEKVPILNVLVGKEKLNFVLTGVLTYAINNTDFVRGIVDGLEQQIGTIFGIEMGQSAPTNSSPVPKVSKKPAPFVTQDDEGTDTKKFQTAVPGAV